MSGFRPSARAPFPMPCRLRSAYRDAQPLRRECASPTLRRRASGLAFRHAQRRTARLEAFDQAAGSPAAHQAAHHQPKVAAASAMPGAAPEPETLGKLLAPRRTGPCPPDMVTDPAISPISGSMPRSQRRAHTDDVLHDQHPDDAGGEEQRDTAAREHPRIGPETDASEEGKHQAGGSQVSKPTRTAAWNTVMSNAATSPPTTGSGNRILLQKTDAFDEPAADHQNERAMASVAGKPNCQSTIRQGTGIRSRQRTSFADRTPRAAPKEISQAVVIARRIPSPNAFTSRVVTRTRLTATRPNLSESKRFGDVDR